MLQRLRSAAVVLVVTLLLPVAAAGAIGGSAAAAGAAIGAPSGTGIVTGETRLAATVGAALLVLAGAAALEFVARHWPAPADESALATDLARAHDDRQSTYA